MGNDNNSVGEHHLERELGLYRHKSGLIVNVIAYGRNADDCKQDVVIFENMEDTDFPKGTVWTKPSTSFFDKNRFVKIKI